MIWAKTTKSSYHTSNEVDFARGGSLQKNLMGRESLFPKKNPAKENCFPVLNPAKDCA